MEDENLLGQDAWIVSGGERITLTKNVRRVDRPWTRFLASYMGFSSASCKFHTDFGGRIVANATFGSQCLPTP